MVQCLRISAERSSGEESEGREKEKCQARLKNEEEGKKRDTEES
jgi:hypothetical protein